MTLGLFVLMLLYKVVNSETGKTIMMIAMVVGIFYLISKFQNSSVGQSFSKMSDANAHKQEEQNENKKFEKEQEQQNKATQNKATQDKQTNNQEIDYNKPVGSISYYLDFYNGHLKSDVYYDPRKKRYRLKIPKLGWDDIYSNHTDINSAMNDFKVQLHRLFIKKYPKFTINKVRL